MEDDLSEYKVQNHGFGGSTDKDLVKRADQLLYAYHPSVVFFQTGSNDYVSLKGNEEDKIDLCMKYKVEMFSLFHEKLPQAKFVVMSGILLPSRSQYTSLTKKINEAMESYCRTKDFLNFVNAEELTFDRNQYHSN